MSLKEDLYHTADKLERALQAVKESKINPQDKKDILAYNAAMSAQAISGNRMLKNAYVLRKLSKGKKKPFRTASREDIQKLIAEIERDKGLKEWSKYDEKVVLKRFYRWLLGKDESFPEQISWLKLKEPKNSKLPEDLVTAEEVQKLVEAARHPRDKAFIFLLYESGARIGELLTLQIKNVQFGDRVSAILVNGKTGQRRVPFIAASSYVSTWVNMHPLRDDPNAPLWVKNINREQSKKGTTQPMSYSAVRKVLRSTFERAGVNKRFNPHNFRHSRATALSNNFTEAQLKEYFGWTQSSHMAAKYVHLSGRDLDNPLMKSYGLETPEEEKTVLLKPLPCPRCKKINAPTFKYCANCGAALTLKVAVDLEDKRKISDSIMNDLMEDTDLLSLMLKKIKQKGLGEKLKQIV